MAKKLSVIIVNYNTRDLLRNCLISLARETEHLNCETIVVDNGSSDGSVELLKHEFPYIKTIFNEKNYGFAKANNIGIKSSEGEYILLLNSDTFLLNNCLNNTLKFAQNNSNVGVIGCKVLNSDFTLQYSCFYKPNFFTEFIFFSKTIIKDFEEPFTNYKLKKYWKHDSIKNVDCVSGCFFLVKRKVFEEVGLLDENFFMYYEDSEFCVRVKKNTTFQIKYFPMAEIIHLKGKSSDSPKLEILLHCFNGARYYLRKTYSKYHEQFFVFLCFFSWLIEILLLFVLSFDIKVRKKIFLIKLLIFNTYHYENSCC